ncbi:protein DA1-related 1-like isoform X2 [Olea europaea var. sylvestris]|uniref:protein DA1-related 1-like isoform X2 n=1 Tax=Olea europaea var. sylvestris TaxID=158386 RepID=UPI000C1D6D3F|nr:protein DA1-related 1-like isoform X2 [Olea europaea var. sylvestris]
MLFEIYAGKGFLYHEAITIPLMGWFRKVCKGSRHKFSEGEYNRRHGSNTQDNYHSTSQLELVEAALENDEQLARALQESLNFEPEYDNTVSNSRASSSSSSLNDCNAEIDHKSSLSYTRELWHASRFRCHECNQLIYDSEFSMSGSFPYHKACYQEHFYPKCEVCKKFLPGSFYWLHPYWKQKSCRSHWSDGTPRCSSCNRLTESAEAKYVAFDDGRKLCLKCMESVIMDKNEFQPVYLEVQEFYEGLDMKIEQEFPMILVDLKAMNEAMYGEKLIQRRPKIGAGNQVTDVTTEPYKLTSKFDVTAILILYGLPRLLTGSIVAHEMMHAWLRLNGYGTLAEDVAEGICQVLAHMWLEYQIIFMSDSSENPAYEKKLGEFYKYQIETHSSPSYGDGFRAGKKAVVKHGLQKTLEHIWKTGNFPS